MGQAFAFHAAGRFSGTYFVYTLLFGVLYQLYLLYTNDHADEAVDRTSGQRWLSGGSRVLPEGRLRGRQLLAGARMALAILAGLALYLAVFAHRPWMPVALILAVARSERHERLASGRDSPGVAMPRRRLSELGCLT